MKKKGFLSVLLATAMLGSMVAAVPAAAADDDQTLTVWCWDPNFNIYAMQQAEKIIRKIIRISNWIFRRMYTAISRQN